jgi:hypothetical protein
MNLGAIGQALATGSHEGYEHWAWNGIKDAIDVISEKRIKVVVNGGGLNPHGLATKVQELVSCGFMIPPVY